MNIIVNDNTKEFQTWFQSCQQKLAEYMAREYPNNPQDELVADFGTRYVKIIKQSVDRETEGERAGKPCRASTWAFIDRTNGDVLKPASWTAPAKKARGNIFDTHNGMAAMGPYGPAYLRHASLPW